MIDLISRQKVIEALTDKVKQLRDMAEGIETWDGTLIGSRIAGIEHAIMYIQTEPPFDIPESEDCVTVVRCKDCRKLNRSKRYTGFGEVQFVCENTNMTVYETDFCSYGERKEEA